MCGFTFCILFSIILKVIHKASILHNYFHIIINVYKMISTSNNNMSEAYGLNNYVTVRGHAESKESQGVDGLSY